MHEVEVPSALASDVGSWHSTPLRRLIDLMPGIEGAADTG